MNFTSYSKIFSILKNNYVLFYNLLYPTTYNINTFDIAKRKFNV